jgi:chemotaxis protein MotB
MNEWQKQDDDVEAGDGEARWLVSYADFITLLMVLFMMLYALQLVKNQDLAIQELRSQPTLPGQDARKNVASNDPIAHQLKGHVDHGDIKLSEDARGLEIEINSKVLFRSGDSKLLPVSKPILSKIAAALVSANAKEILVEGHTDSMPISNTKFESNWELSSARAGAVVRFFVDHGVEPQRLTAMGRADNVPAALGMDDESLALNRRVTVLVRR